MISVYSIKPQFQRLLTPILELLHRVNVCVPLKFIH